MKKAICVLLVVLLALSCLSGCGGQTETSSSASSEGLVADGKTVIDVFAGLTIEFGNSADRSESKNGCGTIDNWSRLDRYCFSVEEVEYDKANADVKSFLKDIRFYWVEKELAGKLSNGDKVHIALEYSKSEAEALGIKLLEETKEYTVSGLIEVYRSESDVDKTVLDRAYAVADTIDWENDVFKWYLDDDGKEYYPNFTYTISGKRTFYEYAKDGNGNEYIENLLLLVVVDWESDYYEDGVYQRHISEREVRMCAVELDAGTEAFTSDYNDRELKYIAKYNLGDDQMDFDEGYAFSDSGELTRSLVEGNYDGRIVEFTYQ